jgi:hypothetical protein
MYQTYCRSIQINKYTPTVEDLSFIFVPGTVALSHRKLTLFCISRENCGTQDGDEKKGTALKMLKEHERWM